MDYLKKLGISEKEYEKINDNLSKEIKTQLEENSDNVSEIINYLKGYDISKFDGLIINRYDLLFTKVENLKKILSKFDKDFIKFVIEEDIQNLIILGI